MSHDHEHHDPGLEPEADHSPAGILTVVVFATLGLMIAAIVAMVPIVSGQTTTLIYEKDLSVSSGELVELQAKERKMLSGSEPGTVSIDVAKAAVAGNPALLTEAFGAAKAPEPVAVAEGTSEEEAALIATGQGLFMTKTCVACHSLDGNRTVGPTFKGLWGRTEKLTDGSEVVVDEAYFARSLTEPNAQVVDTFPPAMPPAVLTDDELAALIAYVKTLK